MIVAGTIKPFMPVNSFSLLILSNKQMEFFIQEVDRNMIIGFKRIDIEKDEILPYEKELKVRKGGSQIHCYLFENNRFILGTLEKLKPKLFPLLIDKEFNPVAKEIICSKYLLHGKKYELSIESNNYLKKNKLNCKFDFRNDILSIPKEQTKIENLTKLMRKCIYTTYKYNYISCTDFIAFINTEAIFNKYEFEIAVFFKQITNKIRNKNAISKICSQLLDSMSNDIADRKVLLKEDVYRFLMSNNIDLNQFLIDIQLSPSIEKNNVDNYDAKRSIMEVGYDIENKMNSLKEEEKPFKSTSKEYKKKAIEIKKNIKRNLYE